MTAIHPAAIVRDEYGAERRVTVRPSTFNPSRWTFRAPGWIRIMRGSLARAADKLESHPGFVRWAVLPAEAQEDI